MAIASWWSDDNKYPASCPGCGREQVLETPIFSHYGCGSFMSGVSGRFIASKTCDGQSDAVAGHPAPGLEVAP